MIFLPIGDVNPRRRWPVVNSLLLVANVALFVRLFFFLPAGQYERIIQEYGFVPGAWSWMDLATYQFLHGGIAHLAGNMLFLWIVGDNVEDKLGHLGYLVFYLACGVASALAHWAANTGSEIPCVGASGSISGVLAAYALLFPRSRIKVFYWFFFFWGVVLVPSFVAIGLWFLSQLMYAADQLRLGDMPGVAYGAHVGGFLFGAVTVLGLMVFGYAQPQRR